MDDKVVEFAGILRKNGIRVSSSEVIDAMQMLREISLGEREIVKDALRGALVKRAIDIRPYNEIFDLYFSDAGQLLGNPADDLANRLINGGAEGMEEFQHMMQNAIEEMTGELSELTEALMRGDRGKIDQLLHDAAEKAELSEIQNVLQVGQFANRIRQALNLDGVEIDLQKLQDKLRGKGMPEEVIEETFKQLEGRIEKLREAIREFVQNQLELEHYDDLTRARDEQMMNRPLYQLSADDVQRMKDTVQRLVERLKSIIQIKRKRKKRGRFDVKKTMRESMQYGGIPFHLKFQDKIIDKPDIVVLCDISDSVRNVSRFFLQFVYSLQEVFSRVRTFVFVSELGEATPFFGEFEVSQAIEKTLWGDVVNTFAHSNYGRALEMFRRDHFSSVREDKTYVIVIGDGRNNYNVANEWVIRDIQAKAKRVIWLNPEARSSWGYGDSEMTKYLEYVDEIHHCQNLNDLAKVIDELIKAELS
ncbi:MAG: VWA domain-containing protein [Chrysiogenetes bacterium]|nr:VWA domain-containing protein [Chrysiogenetes bacterium]